CPGLHDVDSRAADLRLTACGRTQPLLALFGSNIVDVMNAARTGQDDAVFGSGSLTLRREKTNFQLFSIDSCVQQDPSDLTFERTTGLGRPGGDQLGKEPGVGPLTFRVELILVHDADPVHEFLVIPSRHDWILPDWHPKWSSPLAGTAFGLQTGLAL